MNGFQKMYFQRMHASDVSVPGYAIGRVLHRVFLSQELLLSLDFVDVGLQLHEGNHHDEMGY